MKTRHRILVVDDYPEIATAACLLFERLGHEARPATCGVQAIVDASQFEPDVALVDLDLPDLTGFDVASALRRQCKRTPFLAAFTGSSHAESAARAYDAGFDQFILKPVNEKKLRHILWLAEVRQTSRTVET